MINKLLNKEIAELELQEFGREYVGVSNLNYAYVELDEIVSGINLSVAVDEADVVFLFTKSIYKRKGYALKLLNEVFEDLKNQGIKKLFLEVDVENQSALKLYMKLNFFEINRRKNYYDNGNDAIVMERDL